jgi:hypothetical protein
LKRDRTEEVVRGLFRDPAFLEELRDYGERLIFRKAILDAQAKSDLNALGVTPAPEAIAVYWQQFIEHRSLLNRDLDAVFARTSEAIDRAEAFAIHLLPVRAAHQAKATGRPRVVLQENDYDAWARAVLATVELCIFHERALATRKEFLALAAEPRLPSKRVFLEEQDRRIRAWQAENPDSREVPLDRIAGLSAAAASQCQLLSLRDQLKEANESLLPRGSYLSMRTAPRQLRLRPNASIGLRKAMGSQPSDLMVSRAIAATYAIFAPTLIYIPPKGKIERVAIDSIERERHRIPPEIVTQVEERIERTRRLRESLE